VTRLAALTLVAIALLPCSVSAQNPPASDPTALTYAAQAITALTNGNSINDVTLNANVTSTLGDSSDTGTGTFEAKGINESRVDLNLNSGARSDVRNIATGAPGGAWARNGAASTAYASHNCWTDAAWFFPALSALTQNANPGFIFAYIGQEQHGGVNTQHIQVYQWASQGPPNLGQLSKIDFYLDPVSSLALAVAFNAHPDDDMSTNIPVEIDFANYQTVSGIQVPFHFQKIFNGNLVLDVTVTNALVNTGLSDNLFALQ
jgi:hypothetical protein